MNKITRNYSVGLDGKMGMFAGNLDGLRLNCALYFASLHCMQWNLRHRFGPHLQLLVVRLWPLPNEGL